MKADLTINVNNVARISIVTSATSAGIRKSTLITIGKERHPPADMITVTVEEKTESSLQPVLSTEKRKLKCKSRKEKNKNF